MKVGKKKEVKRKDFLAINRNIKLMKKSLIKLRKKMIQFSLTHSDSAQFLGKKNRHKLHSLMIHHRLPNLKPCPPTHLYLSFVFLTLKK